MNAQVGGRSWGKDKRWTGHSTKISWLDLPRWPLNIAQQQQLSGCNNHSYHAYPTHRLDTNPSMNKEGHQHTYIQTDIHTLHNKLMLFAYTRQDIHKFVQCGQIKINYSIPVSTSRWITDGRCSVFVVQELRRPNRSLLQVCGGHVCVGGSPSPRSLTKVPVQQIWAVELGKGWMDTILNQAPL